MELINSILGSQEFRVLMAVILAITMLRLAYNDGFKDGVSAVNKRIDK